MRNKLSLFACLVLSFAIIGCGGVSETDLVGSWKANMGSSSSGAAAEIMDAFAPTLELNEDKTFVFEMMITVEGTWALDDKKLVLTPNEGTMWGSQAREYTVADDGKSFEETAITINNAPLLFERATE